MTTPSINLHAAPLDVVANHYADAHPDWNRTRKHQLRAGIRTVLGRVADQPGATWQQKWVAAGDHADLYFREVFRYDTPAGRELGRHRLYLPMAFKALLADGVIRPGLALLLAPFAANAMFEGVATAHATEIAKVLHAAGSNRALSHQAARRARNACCAMIVFTGKPLSKISVDEWVTVEQYMRDAAAAHRKWEAQCELNSETLRPGHATQRRELLSISSAYSGAMVAGFTVPRPAVAGQNPMPPTLDRAMVLPANLDSVLGTLGKDLPPHVRALIHDTYALLSGGLDHDTLRHHIGDFNTYMLAVQRVMPEHDNLTIPFEHRDSILQLLKRVNTTAATRQGEERLALAHVLSRVRMTYRMTNEAVYQYGLTDHLPTVGTFPWGASVLRGIAKKERSRRKTTFHTKVRSHINHLDGLVEAATQRLTEKDAIRAAARAAQPGEQFTHEGVTYIRAKGTSGPKVGRGIQGLYIRPAGRKSGAGWDVEHQSYQAAQALALTVLLRDTGLRLEEVAELRLDNLTMHAAGDTEVPTVTVNPSKMDRGRNVGLPARTLEVLHDLVMRTRERYGTSPLAERADWHEHSDQPPARLIFFVLTRRIYVGPSREFFAGRLNDVVNYYNAHFNPVVPLVPVRPHQMRRLFSTDLAERGANVLDIKHILGHKQLSTTGIYVHTDETKAHAELLAARRRARAIDGGNQCPCCQGTGVQDPTNPRPHDDVEE